MRQVLELEAGDRVLAALSMELTVKHVQRVPAGDPLSPIVSPFAVDNEVWLFVEERDAPVKFPGKEELPVVGCVRCDVDHPPASCPRRVVCGVCASVLHSTSDCPVRMS